MRAIIEVFDYILYFSQFPFGSEVDIFIDSSYVIRSLPGDQLPSTHHQQVEFAQQYHTALRAVHKVTLHKVSSHTGIPGNELADSLAKRGVTIYGSLGRFSPPRTLLLSPPQLGYNSDIRLSKSPQEQSDFLCFPILNHRSLIPTLPVSPKKLGFHKTLSLITSLHSSTDLTILELKASRKRI